MVPLWYSLRSGALAEQCTHTRRLLPPYGLGGGFVPLRTVSATCPHKNKDSHAHHDYLPATSAMFEFKICHASTTCESQGKRDTKRVQSQRLLAVCLPR